MLLKKGSSGQDVVELQKSLDIPIDGMFGVGTEKAVKDYQKKHHLLVDGIVGTLTFASIRESYSTTDNAERVYSPTEELLVNKYLLPKGEYKEGPTSKEYLFLHHTAGWNNPYNTVDGWANDSRGTIATEFVLGGRSVRGGDDRYDGELVQCIPDGGYGWHLGQNGSQYMHTHSTAIEICNFSYVVDGKTYVGTPVSEDQIITLAKPFRGHSDWHAYSDKQIETLKSFILWIAERDSIDVRSGLVAEIKQKGVKAFEFNANAYNGTGKGMWVHGNVRKDKFDLFPQPNLIDMLLSL